MKAVYPAVIIWTPAIIVRMSVTDKYIFLERRQQNDPLYLNKQAIREFQNLRSGPGAIGESLKKHNIEASLLAFLRQAQYHPWEPGADSKIDFKDSIWNLA